MSVFICVADSVIFPTDVKFPNKASSISLISKGPTAGLLNMKDVLQKPGPSPLDQDPEKEVTLLDTLFYLFIFV